MIIRADQMQTEERPNLRGGEGSAQLNVFPKQDLPPHARLIGTITLGPGCSVGTHTHEGEYEVFYVLSGNPTGLDFGEEISLHPGDIFLTNSGETHALLNKSQQECSVFATIITV